MKFISKIFFENAQLIKVIFVTKLILEDVVEVDEYEVVVEEDVVIVTIEDDDDVH